MAQYARRLLWAGVKIVGGCCGTTPEHIKLIRSEARSLQPQHAELSVTVEEPEAKAQALAKVPVAEKSKLGAKLAAGKFVAFVEILPPRGVDASQGNRGREAVRRAGIDCINVPDGPRASARMSAQVTCQLIQQQAGIEAVTHFCCRDRNILSIQSELLGAHTVGVRNLICITGDPPRMGTYPDATAVFDVDAIGLTQHRQQSESRAGYRRQPDGLADRAADRRGRQSRRAESWTKRSAASNGKSQAGAEYIVTQPVFDLDLLESFPEAHRARQDSGDLRHLAAHQLSQRRVHGERAARARAGAFHGAHARRRQRREGAAGRRRHRARDGGCACGSMVQGVQLSAPFGRYQMAIEVAEAIGPR